MRGPEDELAKAINRDQRIYVQLDRDAVQQALSKHEENCSPKVVYLQDATPEAVEVLAQQNGGCIAIFNDEGVRVLSMMGEDTVQKRELTFLCTTACGVPPP